MKKKLLALLLMFSMATSYTQEQFYRSPDELVIVEGLISFLDETYPLLSVNETLIRLDVPTNVWPGGLNEGAMVRVQGKFDPALMGALAVMSIEIIAKPIKESTAPTFDVVLPRNSEERELSPLENVALAASSSASSLQTEENVSTEKTQN